MLQKCAASTHLLGSGGAHQGGSVCEGHALQKNAQLLCGTQKHTNMTLQMHTAHQQAVFQGRPRVPARDPVVVRACNT